MSANRTHRALQSRNGPKQKALGCVNFFPLPEVVLCNLGLVFFRLPVTLVSTSFSSSHDYSRGGGRQLPNCCSKTGGGRRSCSLSLSLSMSLPLIVAKYSPPSAHYPHLSPLSVSLSLSLSLRGVDNGGFLFSSRFPPPPSRVGRFETWRRPPPRRTRAICGRPRLGCALLCHKNSYIATTYLVSANRKWENCKCYL